ncbi:2OG-Fe(II) oxygenase [Kordiimonas marina]|uniref:2OG-Fe(II) oxygenase n=1 Tax=Kordiimonas marina TaxID=2872312 RepID=UPI001FF5CC8B|nr:2OG-Fe(II) oxygenase [Kordiimonas marina]MCJ9429754.1 2OG-Fe(II) oxygenase [Kordiimonas marina]
MLRAIIDLHLDPRIYTIDNFVSPVECSHLISRAKARTMTRGEVSGDDDSIVVEARTNDMCWLEHDADPATRRIAARVAGLIGMPLSHAESIQMIRYGPGAEYRAHFDAFDPNTPSGKRNWEGGGQRLITALGYLTNVTKGGETDFPNIGITIPPERGKLLVFHNCESGTVNCHPQSLHAGCPVIEGEKWAFNLWFRECPRANAVVP